jgi:hypothetical protein
MTASVALRRADRLLVKYDPDQPRADDGKWSETGGGGRSGKTRKNPHTPRGYKSDEHGIYIEVKPGMSETKKTLLHLGLAAGVGYGVFGPPGAVAGVAWVGTALGVKYLWDKAHQRRWQRAYAKWESWEKEHGKREKMLYRPLSKAEDLRAKIRSLNTDQQKKIWEFFVEELSEDEATDLVGRLKKFDKGGTKRADKLLRLSKTLGKDATVKDWIDDFVNSDNPRFDGKSKKERIRMALGAYYSKRLEKAGFNPDQPRDAEGQWSDAGGAGSLLGSAEAKASGRMNILDPNSIFEDVLGGGPRQKPLSERDFEGMNEREKSIVRSDVYNELGRLKDSRDYQKQREARATLTRLDEAYNQRNRAKQDQIIGDYWKEWNKSKTETLARTRMENADVIESSVRESGNLGFDKPLKFFEDRELGALRRGASDSSAKVAQASTAGRVLLDVLRTAAGETTPEVVGRASAVLGALTILAAGINVASKAKNVDTGAAAVRTIHDGVGLVRSSIPGLISSSKTASADLQNKISSWASRATAALKSAETTLSRSQALTSMRRTATQATGGSFSTVPSISVPRISRSYTPPPPRLPTSTKTSTITMTPYSSPYSSLYTTLSPRVANTINPPTVIHKPSYMRPYSVSGSRKYTLKRLEKLLARAQGRARA